MPRYSFTVRTACASALPILDRLYQQNHCGIYRLDRRFPGLKFRIIDEQSAIRRHMRCFVNAEQTFDLSHALTDTDEILIVQALSGG